MNRILPAFRLDIRESTWLRWLIIAGVVVLSAFSYNLARMVSWKYLLLAVSAAVFALIVLRDFKIGLTLLLLTSATTGITFGTGTSTPIALGMIVTVGLLGLWVLRMAIFERRIEYQRSPIDVPLLAFLIVLLVSWAFGNLIWDWKLPAPKSNLLLVQAGQYMLYLLSFAVAYMIAHQKINEKDLQLWAGIVIAIGFSGMLLELVFKTNFTRSNGLTGSVLIWSVLLLTAQLLFNPNLKRWMYWVGGGALVVWMYWIYQNRVWKGGWAPALLGLAILVFIRSRKLFFTGVLIGGILALANWGFLNRQFFATELETGSTIRPLFWSDVIRMTSHSPILGLGIANYMFYWEDPTFIPQSRLAAGWDKWNEWDYAPPSHNMFVDVYAQSGMLGTIFFVWGMLAAVWILYKVFKQMNTGFLSAYTTSIFAGFISMLVASFLFADWLIPFVYNIRITGFAHSVYSWILFGSVLGIYYRLEKNKDGSNP